MRLIPLIIFLFLSSIVMAQENYAVAQDASSYSDVVQLYHQYTDEESPVYYGKDYVPIVFATNKPFFFSGKYDTGRVWFSGRENIGLPLKYDLFTHELMTRAKDGVHHVILENEHLDSFTIYGHHFVFLEHDPLKNLLHSGFYDHLYSGKVSLYCLRDKQVIGDIKGQRMVYHFEDKNKYYVRKEGIFYRVENKKDILRLFKDQKKKVRKKIRKAHLKLRSNTLEEGLIKITADYDQLK